MTGKDAFGAPGNDAAPPWIFEACGHVIGHDVENEAHIVAVQRIRQPAQPIKAAERGVDLVWIRDVITVRRSADGGHQGGGIEMADPQSLEIGNQLRCPCEVHAIAELQAVGRAESCH